jgi:3-deoxy-D-manno-octulosonate 8-phosphate phosphatase (KDO 8-P phosphatase)
MSDFNEKIIAPLVGRLAGFEPAAVISDIDGVVTSGSITFDEFGRCLREFSVVDGQGQVSIQELGVVTGYISSSKCKSGVARLLDLGAAFVETDVSGESNAKLERLQERLKDHGIELRHCLYLGDDKADQSLAGKAGLFVAPANASLQIAMLADIQIPIQGGAGFYRAVAEALHFSRHGKWIGG